LSLRNIDIQALSAVEAELNYMVPMTERPWDYAYDPEPGVPHSNSTLESRRFAIRDMRPVADLASLDDEGFAVVRRRSAMRSFYDNEEIRHRYYPETEVLIADATGADRVLVYDHTVRRHIPGTDHRRNLAHQPAREVHVDQTVKSGPQRACDLLGAEAEELLRGRAQIINLWRPIRGPVQDAPLAVCDASSVAPADLVPSDLIYRDRIGETYAVLHNPAHRWFYLPAMTPDETLLLKCFDSATDGRARFTPHSAFTDPTAPADAPLRESIEMRALVFHKA
jgi:hypothetical protein